MADLGPRDRLDVPIWNAIEANNLKQAIKLVDKRLAKKPSDYLEVSLPIPAGFQPQFHVQAFPRDSCDMWKSQLIPSSGSQNLHPLPITLVDRENCCAHSN